MQHGQVATLMLVLARRNILGWNTSLLDLLGFWHKQLYCALFWSFPFAMMAFWCYSQVAIPSDTNFNWVGAPEMEVIFLNDLRYSDKIMPWNVFLNFLEGAEIQVSMPKNHFAKDVTWSRKQPIFATADKPHSPRTP